MKLKLTITVIVLHYLSISYGQIVALDKTEQYADTFANNLLKSGVGIVIIYSIDPIGAIMCDEYTPDMLPSRPTYFFWKNATKTLFKRFDIYYPYMIDTLDTDTFIDYIIKSKDIISKENIYEYEKVNTNGLRKTLPFHETFFRIKLISKTEFTSFSIPGTAIKPDNYFFDSSINHLLQIQLLNHIQQIIRPYKIDKLKSEEY